MNRKLSVTLAAAVLAVAGAAAASADDKRSESSQQGGIVIDIDRDALEDLDVGDILRQLRRGRLKDLIERDALENLDLGDILEQLGDDQLREKLRGRIESRLKRRLSDEEGEQEEEDTQEDVVITLNAGEQEEEDESEDDEDEQVTVRKVNYIGIVARSVSGSLAEQLSEHLEDGQGLVVLRVLPDSPAEEAGVKRHDVLVSLQGTPLESARQLRKLISDAEAGEKVELKLIRSARSQTVEATVGTRSSSRSRRSGSIVLKQGGKPMHFHWRQPRVDVDELRRQWIDTDELRGRVELRMRDHLKILRDRSKGKLRNRALTITSKDGKEYKIHIKIRTREGEPKEYKLEGTLEEIREQAEEMTDEIREEVEGSLERLDEKEGEVEEEHEASSFQFHLQPRVAADGRGFRITIVRPEDGGGTKLFELDQDLDLPDEADIEEYLLQLEELRKELEELAPTIRKRVEETIRSIRIPQIEVQVEESS